MTEKIKKAIKDVINNEESTFTDSHPGGVHHEHVYERIIAQKIV
ncbi:MAG: hypothetical protein ACYCYI_01645 [Saccharofermentanales bacterium]